MNLTILVTGFLAAADGPSSKGAAENDRVMD